MTEAAARLAVDDRKARRNVFVLAAAGRARRRRCRRSSSRRRRSPPTTCSATTSRSPPRRSPPSSSGTACGTVPAALLMRRIGRRPGFIAGMLISAARRCSRRARRWRRRASSCSALGVVPGRLRRGLRAAVPLRGRRHRQPGLPAARHLAGHGGRHRGGDDRPADRHPHGRSASPRFPSPAPIVGGGSAQRSLAALVLLFLDIPRAPSVAAGAPSGRPLGEIARQPDFLVAVGCATSAFALMSFVMTAAPLAMVLHHHHQRRRGARHPVACARHVRAELRHRLADRALRRGADRGDRAPAPHRLRARRRSPAPASAISGWR